MLTRKWLKHSRHENQSNDPDIIPAHRNGGVKKNNGQLRAISTNNAHLLDLLSGWFFEILCSPSKSTTGNPPREHDLLYFFLTILRRCQDLLVLWPGHQQTRSSDCDQCVWKPRIVMGRCAKDFLSGFLQWSKWPKSQPPQGGASLTGEHWPNV